MINRLMVWLMPVLLALPALATAELKAFLPGSLEQITADRQGRPFLLVLWSVDCPPCMKEFRQLQQLRHAFTDRSLVLVSTDGPEVTEEAQHILTSFELQDLDNWIFADNFPERLRYGIDPNWFGELPRAYFYDAAHQRSAKSGALSEASLQQWLQQTQAVNDTQ